MFKSNLTKLRKNNILSFSLPILSIGAAILSTSCTTQTISSSSQFADWPLNKVVNLLYGDIEIVPTEYASKYPATSENWPVSNISKTFFIGFPESQEGIDVNVENASYNTDRGEIEIVIKYSRGSQDSVVRSYRIKGFAIETQTFDEIVDNLYGDVAIYLTEKAEKLTASPEIWSPEMINPQYFYGLPTKQQGISVSVDSIVTNEKKCSIEISFKYSKDNDYTIRTYVVTGFKKVDPLWNDINEFYSDIEITLTDEAKKMTATESNWPISKINSTYFIGLPKPKNGIVPNVKSVICEPNEGYILIQYSYNKGTQAVERTYGVTGFKKI